MGRFQYNVSAAPLEENTSQHFRRDSMTITEPLSQEAEQLGEQRVQSKVHLDGLTAGENGS